MTNASTVFESAITMTCAGERLVGILSHPLEARRRKIGVLIVVGGPQYRVGSHRQFVQLARRLAAAGYPVLRFDMRGMGDSGGEAPGFERQQQDIASGIQALQQEEDVRLVVLWGLCDGASASLLYAGEADDERVAGLMLLNPWVRSEAGLARTHVKHYYRERLLQSGFWRKLLSGRVGLHALRELARNLRLMGRRDNANALTPFQQRMARGWRNFGGSLLLLLSERDLTAQEFIEHVQTDAAWQGWQHRPALQRHEIAGADHTLSTHAARLQAEDISLGWLDRLEHSIRPT